MMTTSQSARWLKLFLMAAPIAAMPFQGCAQTQTPATRDTIAERETFKGSDAREEKGGFDVRSAIVVVPDKVLPVQQYAAQELIEHVAKSLGVTLPLLKESDVKPDETRPRFYIGGVRAVKNIGVSAPSGLGEITFLDGAQVTVLVPDALRKVPGMTPDLWQASNIAAAGQEARGFIDVILDLGAKKNIAALALKNRADTATNYNIGRMEIAVGAADDGKTFERVVGDGTPMPNINEAAAQRTLKLASPVAARFVRIRIHSNQNGVLSGKDAGGNVVWSGLGYVVAENASAAKTTLLNLETLPASAFLVRSADKALYLVGRDENGEALSDAVDAGTLFAVYEWLDRQIGVKWLWPGEAGTNVPQRKLLSSGKWDVLMQPPLLHARWRQIIGRPAFKPAVGGFTDEQRNRVVENERRWYRRQRFARGTSLEYGHGYIDFWDRFHQTHPEHFNLLPDGTRRSDPFYYGGRSDLVAMSVGNEGFQNQVIEDWKARRSADKPWVNGWENDTNGKCLCADCLKWDVRDPALGAKWDNRVELARKAFQNKEPGWENHLGQMTDRYAKYYLALQNKARTTDSAATVIGGAYANYAKPPLTTKLNHNIVIGVVPEYGWPMNQTTFKNFSSQWLGWRKSGVSLYLRPNYTLWGHEQPIITARDYARDFQLAYKNGMIATDYDSLTSMFATHGLNIYTLSRLHWRPDWPVEKIFDEYYSAFGAGKKDVKSYFEYWEKQTQRAARQMAALERQEKGALLFGNWAGLHRIIGRIYKPENYATAAKFLQAAHAANKADKAAQQRVEFLQVGLEDARLVALTNLAHEEFKRTQKDDALIAAVGALDAHRRAMAERFPNALNIDLAAWMENRDWNRAVYSAINTALTKGTIVSELPREWRLRWDENKAGERDKWFENAGDDTLWQPVRIDAPWESQEAGKKWREANGNTDYNGMAWYRTKFKVDEKWRGKKLVLLFGAVDEAATVYLNGKKVGAHPFVNPNDWETPFTIELGDAVKFGNEGENELMVLVEDNSGAGGVWKPAWLIQPK